MTNILADFLVLEGLDGAGTTTQLGILAEEFARRGLKCHATGEPTENPTGRLIRSILAGDIKVPQSTVAYMFAADRDNHLNNPEYGIIKHINDGETVISDRYFFSSLAYQSIGFEYEAVEMLNSLFPFPEKVIYLDTPVEDCLNRIESRGGRKEIYERREYLEKVRTNYERCLSSLPLGCKLIRINGAQPRETIFNEIKSALFG